MKKNILILSLLFLPITIIPKATLETVLECARNNQWDSDVFPLLNYLKTLPQQLFNIAKHQIINFEIPEEIAKILEDNGATIDKELKKDIVWDTNHTDFTNFDNVASIDNVLSLAQGKEWGAVLNLLNKINETVQNLLKIATENSVRKSITLKIATKLMIDYDAYPSDSIYLTLEYHHEIDGDGTDPDWIIFSELAKIQRASI